jgi:hypothetical protein
MTCSTTWRTRSPEEDPDGTGSGPHRASRPTSDGQPGKLRELVNKFKELGEVMKDMDLEPFRIYTDVAGEPFWTLVLERDYETLDEVVAVEQKVMADERAGGAMAGYHDLVRSGRREIYKVEA